MTQQHGRKGKYDIFTDTQQMTLTGLKDIAESSMVILTMFFKF